MGKNISKQQWEKYKEVQDSCKINMFGYDFDIQHNYEKCVNWFDDNKHLDNLII